MKACFTFFRMRLLGGLQYRTAALAGIVTQVFWGGMEILLYHAFWEASPQNFPMGLEQIACYIWLRQALFAMLDCYAYENDLFDLILSGSVAYELCRPASLYGMWFARTLALRLSRVALRCGPVLVFAVLLPSSWGLSAPASPLAFACFLVSLALCACVGVAFGLIVYFSCFYTLSSEGVRRLLLPIANFMSGNIIPLPFLPDGLARVMSLSPFAAMSNAPLRIYSGQLCGAEMAQAMTLQVFWLAALGVAGWMLQRRGLRRLNVQGG